MVHVSGSEEVSRFISGVNKCNCSSLINYVIRNLRFIPMSISKRPRSKIAFDYYAAVIVFKTKWSKQNMSKNSMETIIKNRCNGETVRTYYLSGA